MGKGLYNVAVIGATGNIGLTTLDILIERRFPCANVTAVASARSAGVTLRLLDGREIKAQQISQVDFNRVDLAFFCAGSAVSAEYAAQVAQKGCLVIDKTSFFRMRENIPLVVPEINLESISDHKQPSGVIACPNCIAIPLSMTLSALIRGGCGINNVVVSTYQSVSGAGRQAVDALKSRTLADLKDDYILPEGLISPFPREIAFNAIPQIGNISASNAYADEEDKIMREVAKILGQRNLNISVTCVRAPTLVGHGISVYVELDKTASLKELASTLRQFPNISFSEGDDYATPAEAAGRDEVFVGRLRKAGRGYSFWVVTDNLRKGAALNGVQIAEQLIAIDPSLDRFKANKT
ncbi:MAG: aspartate-semialdehyde dehydrogenase [Holosporales bacterium]|jgi:aspartate-semialdehyde dehydrogenase|nr:aspartate-semialdehyde dehydrogenase [Holosporales bacterium]